MSRHTFRIIPGRGLQVYRRVQAPQIAEHYKVEAVEKMEKYRAGKMQEAEANLGMLQ